MHVGNWGLVKRNVTLQRDLKPLDKNGITSGKQRGFTKSKCSKLTEFPFFELADPIKSHRHMVS